jgi:hypothetical protein
VPHTAKSIIYIYFFLFNASPPRLPVFEFKAFGSGEEGMAQKPQSINHITHHKGAATNKSN